MRTKITIYLFIFGLLIFQSACTEDKEQSNSEIPVAAFTATPLNGTPPLTVTFTDQSTNNPVSWQWNFGDGG